MRSRAALSDVSRSWYLLGALVSIDFSFLLASVDVVSFDREYSSPAYAPTPRKYATSPLGNHGAGSRCPRHTLYYRTTRTSEPDLRSGHVRRLVETPHSGPRGRSPWTRWLRLLRPLAHLRRYRSDDRRRYHLAQ